MNEGKTPSPLRTACCFTLRLRTKYGYILALRTAYRLTTKTKQKRFRVFILYEEDKKYSLRQARAHSFLQILVLFYVLDIFCSF